VTNPTLVLHVGYHKTATTYLQRCVFGSHPEILYLGRPWVDEELRRLFRTYKYTHDLDFDPHRFSSWFWRIAERVGPQVWRRKGQATEPKVLMASSESLHSGPEWFGLCVASMAERLKAVFSPCEVILGFRNQADYVESNYREYVRHGGKLPFKRFVRSSFACNLALLPKLQYDKVLALYRRLFGPERVHVYLQERLGRERSSALAELMELIGMDAGQEFPQGRVNVGWSKTATECMRLVNKWLAQDYLEQYFIAGRLAEKPFRERLRRRFRRLFKRANRMLASAKRPSRYLDEATREQINARFKASNEALAAQLGQDIRELGYRY